MRPACPEMCSRLRARAWPDDGPALDMAGAKRGGNDDEQSGTTSVTGQRDRDGRNSGRRPQPALAGEHTGDPAPAAPGTLAAVPNRGDLALRRARAGLVLEQHLLR